MQFDHPLVRSECTCISCIEAAPSVDFGDPEESDRDEGQEASASPRGRLMEDMFRVPKKDGTCTWRFSREIAVQDVTKVLQWREEALQGQPAEILPWQLQKELQRKHYEDWANDPANAEQVRKVTERHKGVNHKILRDLNSQHRVFCFERFGGRDWMHLLMAFGRFDDEILAAVNKAGRERYERHRQQKGERWVPEEVVEQTRASAPTRGRVVGVQHCKSAPKTMREGARRAEKKLNKARKRRLPQQWRSEPSISEHSRSHARS